MERVVPYRLVRPGGDEGWAQRGLRVLVGGPEGVAGGGVRSEEVEERVAGFLAYAGTIGLDIQRQVLAVEGERVVGMGMWVPAAGRTAMLFATPLSDYPEAALATEMAIVAAVAEAREAGVVMVQAMMEPADAAGKTVFAAAGLVQLATLTYMERRPPMLAPKFVLPGDLAMEPYSAGTHEWFKEAIGKSYEETLDCPAMSGMREVEDVMAGHKAVGRFDPQLWGVLMQRGKPVGCLLLAEIPARRALELVYLGLAKEVRGQGLGRLLMQRVLGIATRRGFEVATLAVDAANGPAAKLYRRVGYTSVAQRVAMIRRL